MRIERAQGDGVALGRWDHKCLVHHGSCARGATRRDVPTGPTSTAPSALCIDAHRHPHIRRCASVRGRAGIHFLFHFIVPCPPRTAAKGSGRRRAGRAGGAG